MITVTSEGNASIQRAILLLQGVPRGMERAMHNAAQRASTHVRKEANKEIRKKYAAPEKSLKAHGSAETIATTKNGIYGASVRFRGTKLALIEFNGSGPDGGQIWDRSHRNPVYHHGEWSLLWPGLPAKGHQLVGTGAKAFTEGAFVGKVGKGGHIGIFEKTGAMTAEGSDAIHQLMGSAPPQMIDNDEVKESLTDSALEVFNSRLDHEVARILNGWGK